MQTCISFKFADLQKRASYIVAAHNCSISMYRNRSSEARWYGLVTITETFVYGLTQVLSAIYLLIDVTYGPAPVLEM
jgi:hypothetical protein